MERIKENKILKVLGVLIISIVILLVTRITYAYLAPVVSEGKNVDISGEADLVDDFKLEVGNALEINATPTTLPENGSNYVSSTKATSKLKANSTNNSASKNYYLYLQITGNTFEYVNEGSPEILLSITNPNGDAVTSLGDLTYGTFNGVAGFDVTKVDGVLTIADNYVIESTSSSEYTEQEWTITLTYLNQSYDQSSNFGNSLEANVYFQKEGSALTFDDVCNSGDALSTCVKNLSENGTSGVINLYYHDSNLENGAEDNSYRYAGVNPNNYVCFGSDDETCPEDNLYRMIGVFGDQVKLIKADYASSNLLGTDGDYYSSTSTGDYSTYRGSKTSVNTYRWNYANISTTYSEKNSYSVWSYSKLNTVNLNTNYITNITDTWANKIADTTWKVGGNTWNNIVTSNIKTTYANEVTNPNADIESTYSAKIGLMYISDYGFAAKPSAWASSLSTYNSSSITTANWMYLGFFEWTITPMKDGTDYVLRIHNTGLVDSSTIATGSNAFGVRPVFYLLSSVTRSSGIGTKTDPVRLG